MCANGWHADRAEVRILPRLSWNANPFLVALPFPKKRKVGSGKQRHVVPTNPGPALNRKKKKKKLYKTLLTLQNKHFLTLQKDLHSIWDADLRRAMIRDVQLDAVKVLKG